MGFLARSLKKSIQNLNIGEERSSFKMSKTKSYRSEVAGLENQEPLLHNQDHTQRHTRGHAPPHSRTISKGFSPLTQLRSFKAAWF